MVRNEDNAKFPPVEAWKPIGKIDTVPIPSGEMLQYALEEDTLNFKGLALHVVTTMTVADTLIGAIETRNKEVPEDQQFIVDRNTTLETMVAYHASRPLAEAGTKGEASDYINAYMQTHTDVELAHLVGIQKGLPLQVVHSIEELIRDRGFPDRTIGPNNPYRPGEVDWNVALTQLASWSVAGPIVSMDKRFDDLIRRHAGADSSKKLTKEELIFYKNWGSQRLKEVCGFLQIDPQEYLLWLKSQLQSNYDSERAQRVSDDLIRTLFSREAEDEEFLPTSPAYQFMARSIMSIEPPATEVHDGEVIVVQSPARRRVERLMAKPQRFLKLCETFGLIAKDGENYVSRGERT